MKKGKIIILSLSLAAAAFLILQITFIYTVMFSEIKAAEEEKQEQTFMPVQKNLEEVVIRNGAPDSGKVTISCNVDWGEEVIPDMLKIFRENDVKITFFVSGRWAENHPELLREMYMEGHEIQSHGYGHKLCTQISADAVKEEIIKTEAVILDIISVKTNVFAPPSGDYDDETVELCRSMGYNMALWSADTIDWREGSTAAVIKERILQKELNGGIILMHPKPETVKALPELISEIKNRGLTAVPLYRLPL